MALTSRSNRSLNCAAETLTATKRFRRASLARYTSPHATLANFGFHAIGTQLRSWGKLLVRGIEQAIRMLPGRAIQHRFARTLLREHSFHGAPDVGIGLRQQRRPLRAGNLQGGVIKFFNTLPALGSHWGCAHCRAKFSAVPA